jgi:hypothetical protein
VVAAQLSADATGTADAAVEPASNRTSFSLARRAGVIWPGLDP